MTYMRSIRDFGYLNQASLLRKDFKIRGIIDNAEQIDRLCFPIFSHQINNEERPDIVKRI